MNNITTKTAQSLHYKWCEQMRKKGRHGPREHCDSCEIMQHTVYGGNCNYFDASICAWPDLPESRRQEYLATAKAVLPEIVGEVFEECVGACDEMDGWRDWEEIADFPGAPTEAAAAACHLANRLRALRDRRLEELGK